MNQLWNTGLPVRDDVQGILILSYAEMVTTWRIIRQNASGQPSHHRQI